MNVFMSPAYDDELVYNVCTRYLAEFPTVSRERIITDVFGANIVLSPHLPRNLYQFCERTSQVVAKTKEEMFWWHSMYPFICAYQSEERRAQAREYAFYGRAMKSMPAILAAIEPPKFLRWCPDCVVEDRARPDCGEAYWHRTHQIPGVWQCDKHGTDLVESQVPRFASVTSDQAAELVIPQEVRSFGKNRPCSPMEASLRTHLVALLTAGHFEARPEHPNFREAAARAGFGQALKIDYTKFYEAFSGYWSDVLERLNEAHRTRLTGVSWLRAQFNSKGLMGQPVVRELFDIFFRDRCGLDVYQMPPLEPSYKRSMPVFYCPNPYAAHGPDEQVKRVYRCKNNPGVLDISCKCGFTAMVAEASAGRTMTMVDVIKVGKFGPTWPKQCAKLRAEGKGFGQVATELNLPENSARYLWRQSKPLLTADGKKTTKRGGLRNERIRAYALRRRAVLQPVRKILVRVSYGGTKKTCL